MLSQQHNDKLCLTGPGTPMGDVFRRFWMPALLSREIAEPDSAPVRVRLLGEDFVAFRDSEGHAALVDPHCPHRGANLFFGRNEKGGIRCAYHGWKFSRTGECLDMPSVPCTSDYRNTIRLKTYPVRESGGMLWAYLGPEGTAPELPQFEFAEMPEAQRYVSKKRQQCNWAQCCEGAIDTAHFSFLHMALSDDEDEMQAAMAHSDLGATDKMKRRIRWIKQDGVPRFSIQPHDAGFLVGAARHADGDEIYWRISQFLMPNHSLAPGAFPGENHHGQTFVPIDDHSCWIYCYSWNPQRALSEDERAKFIAGQGIHAEVDAQFMPVRNRDNDYLIDREEQRLRTFTGIKGLSEQDACIQDSQGFIADRTREHLGPTDLAIVHFRRAMLRAADALSTGTAPPSTAHPEAYHVRSGALLAHKETPLEQAMVFHHADPAWRIQPAPSAVPPHEPTR